MEAQVEFKGLVEFMRIFKTNEDCMDHLKKQLFGDKPKCKKCQSNLIYIRGKAGGFFRAYKCRGCKTSISILKGTMFFNTNLDLTQWFIALYMYSIERHGLTAVKLSEILNVTYATAWHMLHRIRKTNHLHNLDQLHRTVEADETYVGGKGKKGGKRGRGVKNKKIVFGMVQRNGTAYAKVVANCGSEQLHPIIRKKLRRKSTLVTDQWTGYNKLDARYRHKIIPHKVGRIGRYHTNTIESFWNGLKHTIKTYYGVSKKHLQKYVDEVVFKYNTRLLQVHEVFNMLIEKCLVTTSYRNLIDVPYVLD